jgi:hypothetical protein
MAHCSYEFRDTRSTGSKVQIGGNRQNSAPCSKARSQTMNTVSAAASSAGEYVYIRLYAHLVLLSCTYSAFVRILYA